MPALPYIRHVQNWVNTLWFVPNTNNFAGFDILYVQILRKNQRKRTCLHIKIGKWTYLFVLK